VLIDVKTKATTPDVLKAITYQMNERDIVVYAIGSFIFTQNEGIQSFTQKVSGKFYPGPIPIKFFHFSGDLQLACLKGMIYPGNVVMYNGGSMIDYNSLALGPAKKASYDISSLFVQQLREYKEKFQFEVTIYVQEHDIDDKAARMLVDLVNSNADIFTYGFAWGGLDGLVASDIQPTLTDDTVGTSLQGLLGHRWDTSLTI